MGCSDIIIKNRKCRLFLSLSHFFFASYPIGVFMRVHHYFFFLRYCFFHSLSSYSTKIKTTFSPTYQCMLDSSVWTIMTLGEIFFLHSCFVYRHMEEAKKGHSLRINMFIIFYSCLFFYFT